MEQNTYNFVNRVNYHITSKYEMTEIYRVYKVTDVVENTYGRKLIAIMYPLHSVRLVDPYIAKVPFSISGTFRPYSLEEFYEHI